MARINIDENWWNDPRRERLSESLGDPFRTEGVSVKFWKLSQTYWQKGMLIPGHVFTHLYGAKALLSCGLARIYDTPKIWVYPDRCERYPNGPERAPNEVEREMNECRTKWDPVRDISYLEAYFIYANGSREHHFWMIQGLLQRVEAGKKSAMSRKLKNGTAQPKLLGFKIPERKAVSFGTRSNGPRTDSNGPEPSYSSSSSFSSSNSKKEEEYIVLLEQRPVLDYEALYCAYPQRKGSQRKADALRACHTKFKSQEQYDRIQKAIKNYADHIRAEGKEGTEFVLMFKTFVNSIWEEWIEPRPNGTSKDTTDWSYVFGDAPRAEK